MLSLSALFWLPAFALVLFFRNRLLIVFLLLSAIFQATAVANVQVGHKLIPLLPYYLCIILLLLIILLRVATGRLVLMAGPPEAEASMLLLGGFLSVAAFMVLIGPFLFHGLPVYVPGRGIDFQYHNLGKLHFRMSMVGQLGYLFLNCVALWMLTYVADFSCSSEGILRAIGLVTVVAVSVGLWEFLHKVVGLWFPVSFFYSAKGWALGYNQSLGGYGRINGTFTEPSTLAAYMGGSAAFWARYLISRFSWWSLFILGGSALVLLLTSSATAYLVLLALFLVMVTLYVLAPLCCGRLLTRGGALLGLTTLGGTSLAVVLYSFDPTFAEFAKIALLDKSGSLSFLHRMAADKHALQILIETSGLGVGLGGNRPSSLIPMLLSTTGLSGCGLFLGFLVLLSVNGIRTARVWWVESPEFSAVLTATCYGLWFTLLSMAISLPDLSYPPLWAWLIALVLMLRVGWQRILQV